jgi:hypothetical protein
MTLLHRWWLVVFLFAFADVIHAQNACNQRMSFCWFGPYSDNSDEVQAWGNHWVSQDKTEKPLEQVVEVRCIKALKICIVAHNQRLFTESMTAIDIYYVTRWDDVQVNAKEEHGITERCEEDSLMINHAERSVLLVSSPGVDAANKSCTNFMGKLTCPPF